MKYKKSYDNDGRSVECDHEEFEEEVRKIKKTTNDKDNDEINIDRKK